MTLHSRPLATMITNNFCGDFQSRISGRIVSFWSSLGVHSFEFRRVLTAARQQWTLDSDSELDFDGFVNVEFGENGHFAANLAPETMWIYFFFLTGMSERVLVKPGIGASIFTTWHISIQPNYCERICQLPPHVQINPQMDRSDFISIQLYLNPPPNIKNISAQI